LKQTIVLITLFACIVTTGCASGASTQTSTSNVTAKIASTPVPTSTPKATSTPSPTPTPTSTPTPQSELTMPNGPAKLGVVIDNFTRIYGQPDAATSSPGVYNFNSLQVLTSTDEDNRANDITVDHSSNDWSSVQSALPDCEKFMPSDAMYQRTVELYNPSNGIHTETERVYVSSELAPLFQASDYTDEYGKIATPGTFGIVFEYDVTNSPSSIDSCSIQNSLMQIRKS
jgi:hypothetical protein